MRCAPLARRNATEGSAVASFSLVAPLVALVFVAVISIASVLGQRVILAAAASSGARMAATLGATNGQTYLQVNQVLESFSITPSSVNAKIWRGSKSGLPVVYVKVTKPMLIPWLHAQVDLSATAHRIDENK
jgi:Flp pilus assembly protein TadG